MMPAVRKMWTPAVHRQSREGDLFDELLAAHYRSNAARTQHSQLGILYAAIDKVHDREKMLEQQEIMVLSDLAIDVHEPHRRNPQIHSYGSMMIHGVFEHIVSFQSASKALPSISLLISNATVRMPQGHGTEVPAGDLYQPMGNAKMICYPYIDSRAQTE